jgi:Trp operon repressor
MNESTESVGLRREVINMMDPWWLMLDDLYQKAMNGDTHSKDVYLAMDADARHYYEAHISRVRSIIGNMLRENNDYKEWAEKLHINYDNYPCTFAK